MTQMMEAPAAEPTRVEIERRNPAERTRPADRLAVIDTSEFSNLLDTAKFEHMWRIAQLFSKTSLIPDAFRGKTEDCFVAVQMAIRLGIDPFMFMQNTYVYQGKPGMEGKLAVALINSSGLFAGPLNYEISGEGDDYGCRAWAISKITGERLEGPRVTIATAKAEGWHSRNSKWRSIPEMMMRYRAGAWFGRLYCPERLMGMQTLDEIRDVEGTRTEQPPVAQPISRAAGLLAKITNRPLSEGQTLEVDAEAAQRIAESDMVAEEVQPATERGDQTPEAVASVPVPSASAEPSQSEEAAIQERELTEALSVSWKAATKMMRDAAGNMGRADFESRLLKALARMGRQLDPEKTTPQERLELYRAFRDGRVQSDGTIG